MTIKCLRCGEPRDENIQKCPKCGSGDRLVVVEGSFKGHEMIEIRQKIEGYNEYKKLSRQGEKIGGDGRLARETLIINRETKRKYHIVEVQNKDGEWIIEHMEDQPLA